MNETGRIAEQLRRGLEGEAWHGPALLELLGDVTTAQAASRPIPEGHSIWEIVLHVTAWTEIVRRRLEGERVDSESVGKDEDWPAPPEPTEEDWDLARRRLAEAHSRLQHTISTIPDDRLDERPLGREDSHYDHLHGVIQHDLYHAGQIALLKKFTQGGNRWNR